MDEIFCSSCSSSVRVGMSLISRDIVPLVMHLKPDASLSNNHLSDFWCQITIMLCPTSFGFEDFSRLNLTGDRSILSNYTTLDCVPICLHPCLLLWSNGSLHRLITMVLLQTPPLFHNWVKPKHHNYTFLQTLFLKPSDI